MVLSEQAMRNWRVAALVGSFAAGVCGLYTDYDLPIKEHCFSGVPKLTQDFIDRYVFQIEINYDNTNINQDIQQPQEKPYDLSVLDFKDYDNDKDKPSRSR